MSNPTLEHPTQSPPLQDTFDEFWQEQLRFEAEMEECLNRLRAESPLPEYLAKRKAKDQEDQPKQQHPTRQE